jgi:hypothetical protein
MIGFAITPLNPYGRMPSDLVARYLDSSEFDRWDRFVDASPHGSIYSQSYFLEALSRATDTRFRILGVYKNDELLGGVGVHYGTSRYGDMVLPRPLLYYNGLVVKGFTPKYPSIASYKQAAVVDAIAGALEDGRYASVALSSRHTFDDLRTLAWRGWRLWPRYTYVVQISDLTRQWEQVEQNIRRLVSRCDRDGMKVELSDDAGAFLAMNADTYRRKGVTPYISRDGFVTLHGSLKSRDACQIYFATLPDGRRVAAQAVLMSGHPVTHTWMAGSDPAFLATGASAFLRWKVFEDLSRRGYAYNDLTDAMNPSVARFKSQFGGRLQPSFVAYKELSSRLRLRNKFRNVLVDPLNSLADRLMRVVRPAVASPPQ